MGVLRSIAGGGNTGVPVNGAGLRGPAKAIFIALACVWLYVADPEPDAVRILAGYANEPVRPDRSGVLDQGARISNRSGLSDDGLKYAQRVFSFNRIRCVVPL